jgi:hypothetical protein
LNESWTFTDLGVVTRPQFMNVIRPISGAGEYFQLIAQ